MGYFLGLLLIVALAFCFSSLFKIKFAYTLPFSVLSIITVLYIFGLFTILNIGAYIVAGLIAVASILTLCFKIKNKTLKEVKFLDFSFVVFSVLAILQFLLLKDQMLLHWDEFSHWGTIVKNMFYHGNFGNIGTSVLFPGYPPASGVFHSFFMFLGNNFVEGYMYMSMNILNFSLIVPVLSRLSLKFSWKNLIVVLFALCLPFIFVDDYFANIYVDGCLGLMFAYIVFIGVLNDKFDLFTIINLSLALFVLCITKEAGMGIGIIALLIILIDLIFFRRNSVKEFVGGRKAKIFLLSLPLVAIIFAKLSWKIYLNVFNLNDAWNVSTVSLTGIAKLFLTPTDYQIQIITGFTTEFFRNSVFGVLSLSIVSTCLLLTLVNFFISVSNKEKKRDLTISILFFIGLFAYAITLLILYVFTYSEYEATRLASFDRYFSTYLLGIVMLIFYKLVINMSKHNTDENITENKGFRYICIALSFVAFTCIPFASLINNTFYREYTKNWEVGQRLALEDFSNFTATLDVEKDKVYYVYNNSDGGIYYKAMFDAIPVRINISTELKHTCWSLGEPRFNGDIWSWNLSADDWAWILERDQFTYVYLHRVDQIFIDSYSELFEDPRMIQNGQAFKVERNEADKIQLKWDNWKNL